MASEWLKLTGEVTKTSVYVNLTNAVSIFPYGRGSEIWFLGSTGKEGRVQVKESPEMILERLGQVRNAQRP